MDSINKVLREMTDTIVIEETIALDNDRLREDLAGLYQDIRRELRKKPHCSERMIYKYAALLQKEIELYNPRAAYESGALLGCNPQGSDSDPEHAFLRFVCRVNLDPGAIRVQSEICNMNTELRALLGDACTLIDEFTELYRKCNGILSQRIYDFFFKGYTEIGIHIEEAG